MKLRQKITTRPTSSSDGKTNNTQGSFDRQQKISVRDNTGSIVRAKDGPIVYDRKPKGS